MTGILVARATCLRLVTDGAPHGGSAPGPPLPPCAMRADPHRSGWVLFPHGTVLTGCRPPVSCQDRPGAGGSAPAPHCHQGSAALKSRRPLLVERAERLEPVLGAQRVLVAVPLEGQRRVERHARALVDSALGQTQRSRPPRGDRAG